MPLPLHVNAFVSASIMTAVSTLAAPAFAQGERCLSFLGFCLPPHAEQSVGETANHRDEDEVVARLAQPMNPEPPGVDPVGSGTDPVVDTDAPRSPDLVPYDTGRGIVLVPASYFGRELSIEEQFEFGRLVQGLLDAQSVRPVGPTLLLPPRLPVAPGPMAAIPDATPVDTGTATANTTEVAPSLADEQPLTNEEQPAADIGTATPTDQTL